MKLPAILFFFFFSSLVLALPSKNLPPPSLAGEIKAKKQTITRLSGEIGSLEKNLGSKNRKYKRVLGKKREIEEQIFLLNQSLGVREKKAERELTQSKKLLGKILLSEIDKSEAAELLAAKIMRQNLKKKMLALEKGLEQIKSLKSEMKYLSGRWSEYTELEDQLSSLIELMQRQKSSKTHVYLEEKRAYHGLKQRIKKRNRTTPRMAAKKKKWQKTLGLFVPPLENHKKLEHGKKGVTYIYSKRQPVRATRKGKIVYSDTLSTFGHVVMIDHGLETRSILLGPFETQVKKGALVAEGEILGYTVEYPDSSGKFYFEVRKKNKAQNTIHLLDRNWTAKKGLARDNA